MKKTIKDVKNFVSQHYQMAKQAEELVKELLKEFPNQSIKWNWEEEDTPSISSSEFNNSEDVTDCYITRLYLEDGELYADLHAYYDCEDSERLNLKYDSGVDYFDLLLYINSKREDNGGGDDTHRIINTSYGEVMLKETDIENSISVFNGDNFDNYIGTIVNNINGDEKSLIDSVEKLLAL